jgi:hypothetical protein
MKRKLAIVLGGMATLFLATAVTPAEAAEAKMEAQLVWATNDSKSPDPKHKPVEAELKKRLQELPLRWTNYFEVNRKSFMLGNSGAQRVVLSPRCTLEVKPLQDDNVEVSLIGKGEAVVKRTQPLPKGEILVVGGNAPNATAWLVTVKRAD